MQREIYTNTAIIQVYESWQHLLFFCLQKKTAESEICQMLSHGSLAVLPPQFHISSTF